jgi:hypothetical protein
MKSIYKKFGQEARTEKPEVVSGFGLRIQR